MLNAVGQAQRILLLGGTSDIGLAIVERFLQQGPAEVILALRPESPNAEAAIQALRRSGATAVSTLAFDALDFSSHPALIDSAFEQGDVDVAIIATGVLGDNEEQWQNQSAALAAVQVNYTAGVSLGTLLAQKFRDQGHGTIVALSSVAGMKVRRSNFVYGSAKAGFDAFFTQLGEALRGTGAHVLVVRPGQVRTKMTAGLKDAPLTVNREDVAAAIFDGVVTRKDVVWVPRAFELVTLVLNHIPKPIFRKLPF